MKADKLLLCLKYTVDSNGEIHTLIFKGIFKEEDYVDAILATRIEKESDKSSITCVFEGIIMNIPIFNLEKL